MKFDSLSLTLGSASVTIDWLFPLISSLKKGSEPISWLETTHVSETLRLGRGNRGSIFVLTKK